MSAETGPRRIVALTILIDSDIRGPGETPEALGQLAAEAIGGVFHAFAPANDAEAQSYAAKLAEQRGEQ